MSEEAERVVVVLDASRDVSPSTIDGIWQGLSLKPGDALEFLGVLHQVNNPSTLPLVARKFMGYTIRLNSSSMFRTNKKIIDEEIARKREEYHRNEEIKKIVEQCQTEEIELHIEVLAGFPLKEVAVKSVVSFNATWVILDRSIKKDRRYFLEKLSCKISRLKRDNCVELLRGIKGKAEIKLQADKGSSNYNDHDVIVTYDEMIPGSPKRARRKSQQNRQDVNEEQGGEGGGGSPWHNNRKSTSFPKSSSSGQLTSTVAKYSSSHFQGEGYNTKMEREENGQCAESQKKSNEETSNTINPDENQNQSINYDSWSDWSPENDQVFQNSQCSVCENTRPKIGCKKDFTYGELLAATDGFSKKNYLSEGGFGSVFKGKLRNKMLVAVKLHKSASLQGEKEFKSEVRVLSKARHENLVVLLGSCAEGNQRLLVYEFVCFGSLDQHLSKDARTPLSWEKRMKIALGAAKGLKYLHENNIIHRDMRPNNILVTHDYEALLGDFGLARSHRGDTDISSETAVVGTLGYLAPEYAECGKVSTKTDVYSFGVVLLQLITGLKTTDKTLGESSLVGWARPLLKEKKYPDLIDSRILESHDVHQLFWMVRVAEKCLSKDPQKRLTMNKVVDALSYIMEGVGSCDIRGFSPAPSDSMSSYRDSSASPSEHDDESPIVGSTSMSSWSQMPSPPIQERHRLPLSPSLRVPAAASRYYLPSHMVKE